VGQGIAGEPRSASMLQMNNKGSSMYCKDTKYDKEEALLIKHRNSDENPQDIDLV